MANKSKQRAQCGSILSLFVFCRLNIVPVVYGWDTYAERAPPHSYINARLFPSAHDLAQYLLYLDKNDTAYNEYFK